MSVSMLIIYSIISLFTYLYTENLAAVSADITFSKSLKSLITERPQACLYALYEGIPWSRPR